MASLFPSTGSWFQDLSTSLLFEIVAVDDKSQAVEVQFEDGNIDEFDIDTWVAMNVVPASAPEKMAGAFLDEDLDNDYDSDFDYPLDYGNPLEYIELEAFPGYEDY